MTQFIALTGEARSGKDTAADLLVGMGVVTQKYAFATPLKAVVNALYGWGDAEANGDRKEAVVAVKANIGAAVSAAQAVGLDEAIMLAGHVSASFLQSARDRLGSRLSPRQAYQQFGTDICRAELGDTVWLDLAPDSGVVLTDVRFFNEAGWVRRRGGTLVQIKRASAPSVCAHESEAQAKAIVADLIINNNGTIADLKETLTTLFK